jgi:hypothetical protein
VRNEPRVRDLRQVDQPHAVSILVGQAPGKLDGQAGLTRSPTPVNVSSRAACRRAGTLASSCSRPTKLVSAAGRLWRRSVRAAFSRCTVPRRRTGSTAARNRSASSGASSRASVSRAGCREMGVWCRVRASGRRRR